MAAGAKPPLSQASRIKVISMGEERVGKSCLIKRFCEEKFVDKYVPTIGIDFGVKPVPVERCGQVRINFWDMAGGSEYYAVRSEFYADAQVRQGTRSHASRRPASRGRPALSCPHLIRLPARHPSLQGAMLVFDVCSRPSFERLAAWMEEARGHGAPAGMRYVVSVRPVSHAAVR
jgi:DnaJ family protein C protein 27